MPAHRAPLNPRPPGSGPLSILREVALGTPFAFLKDGGGSVIGFTVGGIQGPGTGADG